MEIEKDTSKNTNKSLIEEILNNNEVLDIRISCENYSISNKLNP